LETGYSILVELEDTT